MNKYKTQHFRNIENQLTAIYDDLTKNDLKYIMCGTGKDISEDEPKYYIRKQGTFDIIIWESNEMTGPIINILSHEIIVLRNKINKKIKTLKCI